MTPDQDADTLKTIQSLAEGLKNINQRISETESDLSLLKKLKREALTEKLPDLMLSVGMQEFKLLDGSKMTLGKFYDAKLVNKERCFQFLRDSGNDGIIKTKITADFGKGEEAEAKRAEKALDEAEIPYSSKPDIHHMTLKSFVKEACEGNIEGFSREDFGVYEGNIVTIK
jgi:hypothetical protein